ncbi:protein BatD [Hymenobacter sp. RP-2-7]|uniref:Protein BatD n=1 Tax=Hymenobacter polaris TaxID=2682546 RepID=A0A7Y0FNX2_9BACT|nr:BatD family protein [Hymenobacter polaris]NML67393.1 protein BatD [Hymenobacter polaris]
MAHSGIGRHYGTAGRLSWLLVAGLLAGPRATCWAQAAQPAAPASEAAPAAAGPAAQPGAGAPMLLPLPATVPLAGPLVLGFRLPNAGPAKHSDFPEIEGFRKEKVVLTTTTRLLPSGQRRTELAVGQRYYPYTEGDYVVPAFDLTVNGRLLHSPAGQVHVGAAPAASASRGPVATGSLDQLLGRPKPQYFYEPPDHAYLTLEADQPAVFVGQGVRVALYLYLQPADQALLNFVDFTTQLAALRQQLRQPTTWQTTPTDPAVLPDTVRRAGQPLQLRFRLADYTYYPLTPQALSFPGLVLSLTKFKLLKKPEPGDNERLAIYKTYRSAPLRVAVRPLPGNPASPPAVGELALRESLSNPSPRTNTAFTYTFGVEGEGNPAAVVLPPLRPVAGLAVYGPEVQQEALGPGRWRKNFRYRLVASRPGPLPLGRLVQLPFFNPRTARYDTLRPTLRAVVRGGAAPPAARPADDAFYGPALARADARLQPLDVYQQVTRYATWLLGGLLVVAAVGAWRASRPS